jgi:hypothetical protein
VGTDSFLSLLRSDLSETGVFIDKSVSDKLGMPCILSQVLRDDLSGAAAAPFDATLPLELSVGSPPTSFKNREGGSGSGNTKLGGTRRGLAAVAAAMAAAAAAASSSAGAAASYDGNSPLSSPLNSTIFFSPGPSTPASVIKATPAKRRSTGDLLGSTRTPPAQRRAAKLSKTSGLSDRRTSLPVLDANAASAASAAPHTASPYHHLAAMSLGSPRMPGSPDSGGSSPQSTSEAEAEAAAPLGGGNLSSLPLSHPTYLANLVEFLAGDKSVPPQRFDTRPEIAIADSVDDVFA